MAQTSKSGRTSVTADCHCARQRAVSGFTGAKTPPRIIARGVPRNCSCLSTPRHPRTLCLGFRDGILLRGMRSVPEMPRTGLCRTSTVLLTEGRRRGACSITSCFRGLCGSALVPAEPVGPKFLPARTAAPSSPPEPTAVHAQP